MVEDIHIVDVVSELERDNLLPCIIFRTSRVQCDTDVQRASANSSIRLAPAIQHELTQVISELVSQYEMERDLITTHPQYRALVMTGVGAHHAGQLLMWRLLLEELMASGYLRVLVATGTVAAGVDFPARTVVITADSRRGSEGFQSLTAAEFQQMSGRAGRRGKDTVGFCVAAPGPFCDARTLLKIAKKPPEPLVSSYFPGPSTVLNLLRYRNVDDLRFTVERSLAAYIDRKHARDIIAEGEALKNGLSRDELEIFQSRQSENASNTDEIEQTADIEDESTQIKYEGVALSRHTKKLFKRIRRLYRQGEERSNRQLVLLEKTFEGLRKLGYLEGVNLSAKGYWAANLCTSIVLELGEIIEENILEGASAEKLAAIVASISGDEHRKYLEPKDLPLGEEETKALEEIIVRVSGLGIPGVYEKREVLPGAAYTALIWLQAADWQEFRSLLFLFGVAEGDAARLLTQTAEQLNQLTRLVETHPQLAYRAEEAKRRILRPPLKEVINLEAY